MNLRELNESMTVEAHRARRFCEVLEDTWDPEIALAEADRYIATPIRVPDLEEYAEWTESPSAYERS